MRFRNIIDRLADEETLPITNDRIAEVIKEDGRIKRITYIGVDIDPMVIRGFVRVAAEYKEDTTALPRPYALPFDGPISFKVYYSRNQDPNWTRLVVNKELLHRVDPDVVRSATTSEIQALVSRIKLPPAVLATIAANANGSTNSGIAAFIDYFSEIRAVVAMLPDKQRSLILDKYREGKLTEPEIAALVGIPDKYVAFVMCDAWQQIRNLWLTV